MEGLVTSSTAVRLAAIVLAAAVAVGCGDPAKNPDNELPAGVVDTPKAGDVLRPGKTFVGGWAVDDSGVAEIRIFLDGRYKASAKLRVPRPDVSKVMPRYAKRGDIHGWNVEVDFGMGPGDHTILVQAIDDSGASRDIGSIPVSVPR